MAAEQYRQEIVERLVAANDFVERYLHRPGEHAVSALAKHLAGELSLSPLRQQLTRLRFSRDQLAPVVLTGSLPEALLAAWLEPERRFHEQRRQQYLAGVHPHQAVISDFLRPRLSGDPEPDRWQHFCAEFPALFVHGQTPAEQRSSVPRRWLRWRSSPT